MSHSLRDQRTRERDFRGRRAMGERRDLLVDARDRAVCAHSRRHGARFPRLRRFGGIFLRESFLRLCKESQEGPLL